MIRFARSLLIALVVSGCTTTTLPSTVTVLATPVLSVQPSLPPTPGSSAEPSASESLLPTAAISGWWGADVSYCAIPAHYRLKDRVGGFAACVGILGDPSASIEMEVGETIDIHMGVTAYTRHPRYPLPSSSDSAVIDQVSAVDIATAAYRAEAPGDAVLMTVGNCLVNANTPSGDEETFGPCPLVRIHVVPRT